MPIYEYQCKKCEQVFEYQQRMSEDPKTECEACQGALERIISRSAFHLKGGGWYKDLYSSPKPGAMFLEAAWLARARARHRLGQGDPPLVTDAMTVPLLLLDDLGQEREDRDGCITDVVYERHNAQLPTWVTCGLANGDG